MSYSLMDFYAHFAINNLLSSARNLYRYGKGNDTTPVVDNLRRYLISAGYIFGKQEWQYEPRYCTREPILQVSKPLI